MSAVACDLGRGFSMHMRACSRAHDNPKTQGGPKPYCSQACSGPESGSLTWAGVAAAMAGLCTCYLDTWPWPCALTLLPQLKPWLTQRTPLVA